MQVEPLQHAPLLQVFPGSQHALQVPLQQLPEQHVLPVLQLAPLMAHTHEGDPEHWPWQQLPEQH